MDTTTVAGARMQRFLEQEPVVWLSTVRPNGAPHVIPIWFWWDGDALLVFSKPDAQKVRNLRDRPLGWHGRQVPRSARLAGAPARSIDESPRERPTLREWLGEPLARGIRAVTQGVRVPVARPASL